VTSKEFVTAVRRIAATQPTYRTGGDGSDGTCDCIGLIMGAIGKSYPMHSSNYFARFQMSVLDSLLDESQLHEGAVVYKSRRDTENLHERYQPGGRYYTGDTLDYYHVGIVTGLDPLEITHCTSTGSVNGIAYDDSIRAWSHFGNLLDVDYTYEEDFNVETKTAIVTANSGTTVNMRKIPDRSGAVIKRIPIGDLVEIRTQAKGWAQICHGRDIGYMMDEFVQILHDDAPETDADMVTTALPRSVAMAVLEAFNKGVGG